MWSNFQVVRILMELWSIVLLSFSNFTAQTLPEKLQKTGVKRLFALEKNAVFSRIPQLTWVSDEFHSACIRREKLEMSVWTYDFYNMEPSHGVCPYHGRCLRTSLPSWKCFWTFLCLFVVSRMDWVQPISYGTSSLAEREERPASELDLCLMSGLGNMKH